MLEVKVTKRDSELTKGIFKVGTIIDLDLEDMVVCHGGMEWRVQVLNDAFSFLTRAEKAEAELQKYKDQYPDYVECANCGSVTHVEGVE